MRLQEAATAASVSLYDMMDFVHKEQIRPPSQSEKDLEDHAVDIGHSFEELSFKKREKF